ncbi:MAG: hypothetical protein KAJ44_00765 [Thermoplasmatales archaeon]|nr:hypothetical protein [Thermoplasmatales archaeon]
MREETVSKFIGKYVKIVKTDGFILYGIIEEVDDNSILFTTDQRTSLLSFDIISAIIPMWRNSDD